MTICANQPQSITDNGSCTVSQPQLHLIESEFGDFRQLFKNEFEYVCAVLRRLGVRPGDLEDVAHDVFLVVHRRLDSFDRTRPLRPWLFGIAYRVTAAYRRSRARREYPTEEINETAHDAPSAEENLRAAQARHVLLQALEQVALERRAILIMHDIDEQPMRVITETLNIPLFTGYSRLRLARKELARAVRRTQVLEER